MSNPEPKKKHHYLKRFIVIAIVLITIFFGFFVIVKFAEYQISKQQIDGSGTIQGNHGGDKQLFRRSANMNDITYTLDLDLSSLGEKCTITPNVDIAGLEVTLHFLDKNKRVLDSIVKQLGNVKEGVQVSFSVSLFDIGLSVAWNTVYSSMAVTDGTVSYFA